MNVRGVFNLKEKKKMNKFLKNALGFTLVAAVSSGVAVGTYAYMQTDQSAAVQTNGFFQQPLTYAALHTSAAENTDFTQAAENTVNGVVHIKATTKVDQSQANRRGQQQQQGGYGDPFELLFGNRGGNFQRPQPQPRVGSGSGVIISNDGYIITNNHVIDGATELEITMNDNRKFVAELIGTDPSTDIALLKIDATDLPVIPFGDSEKLKVGEWVLAVGNPFNLTSTVTAGIVSAKGRGLPALRGNGSDMKVESFIQTDAAVNPGNSGGALVNTKGELIGINTAIYSETGSYAGYSFAVPISIAGKIVNDLKEFGAVQRAVLGISMLDIATLPADKRDELKVLEGAYIIEFADFSSAKEAGLSEEDVITHVNGVKVKNASELQEQVSKYRPGDKLDLKVDRKGSTKSYNVELLNRQGSTAIVKGNAGVELLGATFKALTPEAMRKYGTNYGLQVESVSNGKFSEVGIKKGFVIMLVNGRKITRKEDLEMIVKNILNGKSDDQLLLIKGFYQNGSVKHYAIDLI